MKHFEDVGAIYLIDFSIIIQVRLRWFISVQDSVQVVATWVTFKFSI